MNVKDRFLKYVSYWTTSDDNHSTDGAVRIPSTDRQFELGRVLRDELNALGLEKVVLTDHCYVYGMLPATTGCEDKKAIGFISHMDTSPDYDGEAVKPQIIPDYDGGDILLAGSGDYLKVSDFPSLATLKGRTLITTDGTTLLGADDKAGVAEIMTALEEIIASGQPHGDIWVGFTPDEEIGEGADHFDVPGFGAKYAYTLDGDLEGGIEYENFNAASAKVEITGVSVHPGSAKDTMENSLLIAMELNAKLPPEAVPARTAGYEGFFHLDELSGDTASCKMSYIIRDHDREKFEANKGGPGGPPQGGHTATAAGQLLQHVRPAEGLYAPH